MSELMMPITLGCLFGAVLFGGIAVEAVMSGRRRAIRLQAQVGEVPANVRERELSRSFAERALGPAVSKLGSAVGRITPAEMRRRIARKLVLAGSPAGWDAEKVAASKVISLAVFGVLGFLLAKVAHLSGALGIGLPMFLGGVGYLGPGAVLGQSAARRQDTIRKALADTMDLLTISVEAGLGFDAALHQVTRNVPGPLSQEISRMLQEMQLGVSRMDGFRHLADRTDVEELRGFVLAMIQADKFGVSIAGVLRAQAKELRLKRRQRAERKAMTSPLKLLFPMIFCVLPSLFVVVLGPGVIRLVRDFFGLGH